MNFLAVVGAFIITLSLLSYGIGIIAVVRFKIVTPGILVFLTLGVILDFIAVIMMIINSEKIDVFTAWIIRVFSNVDNDYKRDSGLALLFKKWFRFGNQQSCNCVFKNCLRLVVNYLYNRQYFSDLAHRINLCRTIGKIESGFFPLTAILITKAKKVRSN
jgi:hypothetical protein